MSEKKLNGAVGGSLERAVGERKRIGDGASAGVPDPELVERPVGRRFTAEYKLRVLREADAGALEAWGRRLGRKPIDRREHEIAELRRRLERSEAELRKARRVIEIQGNVSALLEQMLGTEGASESESSGR